MGKIYTKSVAASIHWWLQTGIMFV